MLSLLHSININNKGNKNRKTIIMLMIMQEAGKKLDADGQGGSWLGSV